MPRASTRRRPVQERRQNAPAKVHCASPTCWGYPLLLTVLLAAPARGALPASLPIDHASLDALLTGDDVCGAAADAEACLISASCSEVDAALGCSAARPVWLPDAARGGPGGKFALFRRVLPVPAGPHPNEGSLQGGTAGRVVASATYFQLPSAVAMYDASARAVQCTSRVE